MPKSIPNLISKYSNQKLSKNVTRYIKTNLNIACYKTSKTQHPKNEINSSIMIKNVLKILYYIPVFYFICFNLIVECNSEETNYSFITLRTNKTGYIQIISNQFNDLPNEVIINDIVFPAEKGYYLNDSENIIILRWNNNLNTTTLNIFKGCSNITEIDLSYFDTSYIKDMSEMFNGCSSLKSINLTNTNTFNVKYMNNMFSGCSSLKSLDLTNINTFNVKYMNNMFSGCSSLKSINLSNFETLNINSMNNMFYGCSSLKSLDLSNFETLNINSMNFMFSGCSSLKSLDLSNFNLTNIQFMINIFSGCSNLEFLNLKSTILNEEIINKILLTNNLDNALICSENNNFANLSLKKQEINCFDTNNNKILSDNDNILKCYSNISKQVNNKIICRICGENFYMKYDYSSNNINNSSINCFDSQYGFYLDENVYFYKSCYHSCKTCEVNGNESFHNCDECKDDYKYELKLLNYKNCYKSNNAKLNNRMELIKSLIENIFNEVNITEIDNGNDKEMIEKDLMVKFTSNINQKNNENINDITMNLGECENKLKNDYNIPNNDSLYILQIISKEEGMKIPKMEYEIYYPFNNNLTKLDLISCKDTKIEISISVKINGSIDKYNSSSNYYNDICTKTTSDSGTDISLKDRRNEFVDNDMSLCEENCELIDYNYTNEKAKCSCDIKLKIPENYDIKFNKKDFFKNFIDIKNIANINIMKCYKTVLKLKNLMKNYGFFIMLFVSILYLISLLTFYFKSYIKLKKDIKNIYSAIKIKNKEIKKNEVIKQNKKRKKKRKYKKKHKKNNAKNDNNPLNLRNINENGRKDNNKHITLNEEEISNQKIIIKSFELVDINNKYIKDLLEQKDFELNSLNYEQAVNLDKRTFCEYYISLIKNNHPLFFSFSSFNDYNSKIIKIFLCFLSFSLDLTINALFFSDDTMHKIYEDKGKFNILYQIPQILYSTFISKFIDGFIRKLALTQDNIIDLKQEKEKIDEKYIQIKRAFKIKFICFFIISLVFLIFFWYYITCFCGIYVNTQTHLLKDFALSSLTGFIIPFGLYLIPGVFRISALRAEQQNQRCLYKTSSLIENYMC